jgi:hypothetical protein
MRKYCYAALVATTLAGTAFAAVPPEEGKRVIEITRRLEADPLSADVKADGAWLIEWISQSPDVGVQICDTMQILGKKKYEYAPPLIAQEMFGMAAWSVEHPDAKPVDVAVHVAGVRSALKAYAAILAQHPDAKLAEMDNLAAHEAAGDLDKYMEGVVAKQCK